MKSNSNNGDNEVGGCRRYWEIKVKVDYKKLAQIANDQKFRGLMANDISDVLTNYLYMMSNLNADVDQWSASEMAMITNSLNRWQDKKSSINIQNVSAGDIVMADLGLNYAPELSYAHPVVILEELKDIMLVIPATSSNKKLAQGYHPIDNPNGKWFYRKVGLSDGFAHDCVLLLSNIRIISKTSILSPIGRLTCDMSDKNQLYREIKNTILKRFFYKEWRYTCELKGACENQKGKIQELEKRVNLLEKELKNIDNSNNKL